MRKQALLGLLGLLGICSSVMAAPAAVDDRPVTTEKSSVSRTSVDEIGPSDDLAAADDAPGVPGDVTIVDLDPHMVFSRVIVGPDGKVTAGAADSDGGVAGVEERLIYQNVLGINAINFPNNQPVSDDLSTTAPDGCNLTRYKFKVLGRVLPSGVGGAFTLNYALYSNCPHAVGSTNTARDLVKIAGTDGVLDFPDDGPREIEHIVPAFTPVALPTNVYLGLRFSRSNCGTVIGAPAILGFSGDIWDYPGFPCNGYLGGFPGLPHASFWLEMYGTTNCPDAFAGYKCQKPYGGAATIGTNVQGVDDIKLIVNDCEMIGYEVAVKGVGFYSFDLRRECDGSIVAGSERTFQVNASTTPLLQIARFTFNPPIRLTTENLFLGFKCSSNSAGAIIAGIDPIIGSTEVDYFTIGLEGCAPVIPTQGVHGAVNLAITCAGSQPIGACCDPYLTECNAGPNQGRRCANSVSCAPPGTCEAVCRQTSELNCPFPPRGQEQRPPWKEGEACIPDPFLPDACGVAACCHMRPDPENPAVLEEVCENYTKNECASVEPLDRARLWQLGEYCSLNAQRCPRNACLAREGSCYVTHNSPGCSDPFCCSDICAHGDDGAFCCNTAWDSACVALAEILCSQAPPNDQCAPDSPVRGFEGALAIPVPGSKATSNLKATESPIDFGFCCHNGVGVCLTGLAAGEPCIVDQDCGSGEQCSERSPEPGATGMGSIWFKFVQGSGTSAGISTCTSNSPALDSILQVYEANDHNSPLTECNSLSVIACNDDFANCSSTQRNSRVCLQNLTPGATYYVLLASKTDNRRGQYIVAISTSCSPGPTTPANDYCRRATAITDLTPNDPLVVPFTLGRACNGGSNAGKPCTIAADCPGGGSCSAAGPTFDCPSASCSPSAQNDIWYNYAATCTGEATFSTCGSGNPDTNIAVYEGCTTCPSATNNSGFLECNEDNNGSGCIDPARVVVDVTEGQCYKVRVSDQSGFAVSGNLTITCNSGDCQPNGSPDVEDIANCPPGTGPAGCQDCNGNGRPDFCDIRDIQGVEDCQPDGIPDECQLVPDCQPNGIPDACDGGCGGCSGFVSSVPTNCSVDARRPQIPVGLSGAGTPQGYNSFALTFASDCNVAAAVPGDFTVTCNPAGAPCPTINTVDVAGQVVTVNFSSVIPAGKWTCVTHTASSSTKCMGSLPGDCSGNRFTAPADIIDLIDNLNGVRVPALTIDHCDLDRSDICLPADIISLIDMLNGANGFIVWNGQSLEECPNP